MDLLRKNPREFRCHTRVLQSVNQNCRECSCQRYGRAHSGITLAGKLQCQRKTAMEKMHDHVLGQKGVAVASVCCDLRVTNPQGPTIQWHCCPQRAWLIYRQCKTRLSNQRPARARWGESVCRKMRWRIWKVTRQGGEHQGVWVAGTRQVYQIASARSGKKFVEPRGPTFLDPRLCLGRYWCDPEIFRFLGTLPPSGSHRAQARP